ncbi:Heparinase II/III-like [hydrothermal vent metagenome]|uniref:Heparinase II/III-like n=1 Tax=hydrothermal vent metagenome TaxID=652676 RepID=A0A3B1B131_9ZZZZ
MPQIRRQADRPHSGKLQKRLRVLAKKTRYASRYHEFRLKGKHPLRLLGTPKDLWARSGETGSVTAGSHILSNRFYCAGQVLKNPNHKKGEWHGDEIWHARALGPKWQEYLHSFCWLRDLNGCLDRNAARKKALALTAHWLESFDQWHELFWSPDIIGQRIVNWMAYAPLILDSNDLVYRSKILNCLARQSRHLHYAADQSLRGLPRMKAITGLILAGLYIPYGEDWLKKGTSLLHQALDEEILADGGTQSRCPEDIYYTLRNCLMVRASCKAMGHDGPKKLNEAIHRMSVSLKNLRHGDGRLALFNGASEQDAQEIDATLSLAKSPEDTVQDSSERMGEKSGFRRLQQGRTLIIVDTAPPAPADMSQHCHAGTLSFEMSCAKQRIIVNCGSARALPNLVDNDLDKLVRSTAAHSTVVLQDKNSSEIRTDGLIGRGPTMVESHQNNVDSHLLLEASHDGYMPHFGVMHHRTIYMNETGDDVRGEDVLEVKTPLLLKGEPPKFDVCFHIHPDVTITRQGADDRLLLRLRTSEYWQFQCSGGRLSLGESLYLGEGNRQKKCRQIVISDQMTLSETTIKWSLRRIEQKTSGKP